MDIFNFENLFYLFERMCEMEESSYLLSYPPEALEPGTLSEPPKYWWWGLNYLSHYHLLPSMVYINRELESLSGAGT